MAHERFPITEEQTATDEQAADPMQAGAAWLMERGIDYDVAGIQLSGPKAECQGTLAEMVGVPGHSDMKDSVERTIDDAVSRGQDPGEAVTASLQLFAKRDDSGEILRVDAADLKKK